MRKLLRMITSVVNKVSGFITGERLKITIINDDGTRETKYVYSLDELKELAEKDINWMYA